MIALLASFGVGLIGVALLVLLVFAILDPEEREHLRAFVRRRGARR